MIFKIIIRIIMYCMTLKESIVLMLLKRTIFLSLNDKFYKIT